MKVIKSGMLIMRVIVVIMLYHSIRKKFCFLLKITQ